MTPAAASIASLEALGSVAGNLLKERKQAVVRSNLGATWGLSETGASG